VPPTGNAAERPISARVSSSGSPMNGSRDNALLAASHSCPRAGGDNAIAKVEKESRELPFWLAARPARTLNRTFGRAGISHGE
jgi:hypothetical protein